VVVQFSTAVQAVVVVWVSARRVVLPDSSRAAVVPCILRGASLVVALREMLVPVLDSKGPVSAARVQALAALAPEWVGLQD